MKHLLILIFASIHLFAINIILNSGKESKTKYAILHIIDTLPLSCETIIGEFGKQRYLCKADRPIDQPIESKKMTLVEIDFYGKGKEFYIAIDPKVESKLIPMEESLYESKEVLKNPKQKQYKHWMILLQDKPLYSNTAVDNGLDFPVVYEKYQKPYVGALDLNGAPISYAQSKDIQLYLDIKKAFEHGDYDGVVKDSKRVLSTYPQSIFRSELELYNIRSMDKILSAKGEDRAGIAFDENDIVTFAKKWTKEFASDENIPEVFMLMAKSYLKIGAKSDANYFIDILVSEHPQSSFTKKAILLFADNLFAKREKDKALKLYLEVLYSATDLDIASEAAIKLSDHQMDAGKLKEAKEYLLKVLGANSAFLLKDKEESYKLARRLYEHKLYDVAAKTADLLLANTPKKDESRELLLKESGDWHAKADEVQDAYARYQDYLSEYKNKGEYVEEVTQALDALFFKLNETNETKLANYYDKLIGTYENAIGEKALIEKAKLLFKQGKFDAVLAMKESLNKVSDTYDVKPEELIYGSAKSLALEYLKKDECQMMIGLVEEYKIQFEGTQNDEKLFGCMMRLSRFERAKEISGGHLKDVKLENRFAWSQKELEVLFKLGKYPEVITLKSDIFALAGSVKQKISLEILRDIFFAEVKLKKKENALTTLEMIEQNYPKNFTIIDIYSEIVKMANEAKDDLLLIKYAQKIIALQKEFKSSALSPNVELSYIEALKRVGKESEALGVCDELLSQNLGGKDKIRAYYNAGELSLKLKEDTKAKGYFTKCVEVNETSSWKNICEENLKLF